MYMSTSLVQQGTDGAPATVVLLVRRLRGEAQPKDLDPALVVAPRRTLLVALLACHF